jgi:hypothetical protein
MSETTGPDQDATLARGFAAGEQGAALPAVARRACGPAQAQHGRIRIRPSHRLGSRRELMTCATADRLRAGS